MAEISNYGFRGGGLSPNPLIRGAEIEFTDQSQLVIVPSMNPAIGDYWRTEDVIFYRCGKLEAFAGRDSDAWNAERGFWTRGDTTQIKLAGYCHDALGLAREIRKLEKGETFYDRYTEPALKSRESINHMVACTIEALEGSIFPEISYGMMKTIEKTEKLELFGEIGRARLF